MTSFPHMTKDGLKPSAVSRRTSNTWDGRRRLVITLEAGDMISAREEGRRFIVRETAAAFYTWAVKRWANEEAKRKAADRKARRLERA